MLKNLLNIFQLLYTHNKHYCNFVLQFEITHLLFQGILQSINLPGFTYTQCFDANKHVNKPGEIWIINVQHTFLIGPYTSNSLRNFDSDVS